MVSFFQNIINALREIINFFSAFFEMIEISINFIPQPFRNVTLTFLPVLIASIIYKVVNR